jgi:hypothetical protein
MGNHEASVARGSLRAPAVSRSGGGPIAVPLASLELEEAQGEKCWGFQVLGFGGGGFGLDLMFF